MPLPLPKLGVLITMLALVGAYAAKADDTSPADQVIATVNGTEITLGHMIVLRSGLPAQYDQVPAQVLFDGILDQLIQQTVLAQSADANPSRQARLLIENETRAIMASDAVSTFLETEISEEAINEVYQEKYAGADAETEYLAAHILVATEEEAKDLIGKLDAGGDFTALAQEFSTGPSGPNGGDLGWFGEGVMVEPFFNAVAGLEPGTYSGPVQTDFGWHVILLKETRAKKRPAIDEVRADIINTLRSESLDAHISGLEEASAIVRTEAGSVDVELLNDPSLLEN